MRVPVLQLGKAVFLDLFQREPFACRLEDSRMDGREVSLAKLGGRHLEIVNAGLVPHCAAIHNCDGRMLSRFVSNIRTVKDV
jgi:hypothetical protein